MMELELMFLIVLVRWLKLSANIHDLQLHANNDWSDDDQVTDVSEDSAEEEEIVLPQPAHDEGYPHQIEDFAEENVGHEVVSGSDDSGRNSQDDD